MLGIQCEDIECEDRHRQICKYWKSNIGCFRTRQCQYLHQNPKEKRNKSQQNLNKTCDACKFDYKNSDIKVHMIDEHEFMLCLQCDHTIKNNEILLSRTFDMRKVLKMEYPNMSSKDINQLVKY